MYIFYIKATIWIFSVWFINTCHLHNTNSHFDEFNDFSLNYKSIYILRIHPGRLYLIEIDIQIVRIFLTLSELKIYNSCLFVRLAVCSIGSLTLHNKNTLFMERNVQVYLFFQKQRMKLISPSFVVIKNRFFYCKQIFKKKVN